MPIQRVLKRNAVKASHIDLSQNFAFTGTISGAGNLLQCQTVISETDTTLSTGQSYQIVGNSTPAHDAGYTLLTKSITGLNISSADFLKPSYALLREFKTISIGPSLNSPVASAKSESSSANPNIPFI